jgi:UDP:flavonoid glycosyltransferase YjiC (YdhE family)
LILVAVGTFIHGFDELVDAADRAVGELRLGGFAQIGHSRSIPRHLTWERFLPPAALAARMAAAPLVICHGGIGLLGEAMRARKPIIAVPRRGRPTQASPAGDQSALLARLAERHPIRVCAHPDQLPKTLQAMVASGLAPQTYDLGTDVPGLIAGFLSGQR